MAHLDAHRPSRRLRCEIRGKVATYNEQLDDFAGTEERRTAGEVSDAVDMILMVASYNMQISV